MKFLILFLFLRSSTSPLLNLPEPDSFDFAIALVSDVGNNFEPCGCGHPPFRGGELSKKAYVIKFLKKKYRKKIFAFDTGNYVSPSGNKKLLKIFKDVLKIMRIDAMAISRKDVLIKKDYFEYLVNVLKYPFFGFHERFKDLIPPYKRFRIEGVDIYFTSYVPHSPLTELPEYEKEIFDKLNKKLKKGNTFLVMVTPVNTDLPLDTTGKILHIVGLSSKFDVLFKKEKNRYFLRISRFGLYLPVIFFKKKGSDIQVVKLAKIPLNNRIEKDEEVEKLNKKWKEIRKEEVEEMKKKLAKKSRNIKKLPTSEKCKSCHFQQYLKWKRTKHSKAMETLVSLKKEKDFRCVSCHTTRYGKPGGFQSIEATKELANIHCVECHDVNMKDHAVSGKAITYKEQNCRRCHTNDQSPEFDYKKYWEKIKH